jgi:hypothetical protein
MSKVAWHIVLIALTALLARPAAADEPPLADFFGFDGLEIVKIGRQAGPMAVVDMNGDGLNDVIIVNNHFSRIELHYQRPNASPDNEPAAPTRVNEFPDHWRFRRDNLSVTHAVTALTPFDFDEDGDMDIIYTGLPSEIVFLEQSSPGVFKVARRHRVKGVEGNRSAFAIKDVIGDERPELLCLVAGDIHVWTLDGNRIGQPVAELSSGEDLVAFILEDYDGDGRTDIAGIIPESPAPVRVWFSGGTEENPEIGAEVRFEMPAIREFEAFRLPGEDRAHIAVIERASKRLVLYELATEQIEDSGNRDAAIRVYGFTDAGNRKRDQAVIDIDGNGLLDLVATDTESNAIVVYHQQPSEGFGQGDSFPSYADIDYLAAGNVDDDPYAEIFVLSQKEGVVGRADATDQGVPYPSPLGISEGHTPVALNLVQLQDGPRVAVVAKSGRDYVIDLIDMEGKRETISLGSLSRAPETIVALDADQDGRTDLLLFTRDKPMTMLYSGDDGFELIDSDSMGQFGLVKAATADNTAVFDIDDNGMPELLLADKNFVRAVRYVPDPPPGVSPGWQVVSQINALDNSAKLVSVAMLGSQIVAADKENKRLVVMAKQEDGHWHQIEALNVRGFSFDSIYAGSFSGDNEEEDILAVGDDGFAVVRLGGDRVALRVFESWRSDGDRRLQHELASGDINDDGFLDLISLDAGEQMCEVFTFSDAQQLLYVLGFQVFESRLFSGGGAREYEPSQVIVMDVTGDHKDDIVLLAHDRVLVYPQMSE